MSTASSTDILLVTTKDLTVALQQTHSNPLVPPPTRQKRKALQTLTEKFANTTHSPSQASATALPRVLNNITQAPATLPRVLPVTPAMTTASYFDLLATNCRLRHRRKRAAKKENTPKPIKPPKSTRQKPPIATST